MLPHFDDAGVYSRCTFCNNGCDELARGTPIVIVSSLVHNHSVLSSPTRSDRLRRIASQDSLMPFAHVLLISK